MAVATALDLKGTAKALFEAFDRLDMDAMRALMTDRIQGVDEISRHWLRGKKAMDDYTAKLKTMGLANVSSKLTDIHTEDWGEVGLVTLMADQQYEAEGKKHRVIAPVSLVMRRLKGDWKIACIQAVPLSDEII